MLIEHSQFFYNKFNKTLNKHAPFKTLSKRRIKQLSKPWITKGIRTAIKIKSNLLLRVRMFLVVGSL